MIFSSNTINGRLATYGKKFFWFPVKFTDLTDGNKVKTIWLESKYVRYKYDRYGSKYVAELSSVPYTEDYFTAPTRDLSQCKP